MTINDESRLQFRKSSGSTLNTTTDTLDFRRLGGLNGPRILVSVNGADIVLTEDEARAAGQWLAPTTTAATTDDDGAQWDDEKPACAGCES